jgi:hypothetical protein
MVTVTESEHRAILNQRSVIFRGPMFSVRTVSARYNRKDRHTVADDTGDLTPVVSPFQTGESTMFLAVEPRSQSTMGGMVAW